MGRHAFLAAAPGVQTQVLRHAAQAVDHSLHCLVRARLTEAAISAPTPAHAAMIECMEHNWVEMSACYRSVRAAGDQAPTEQVKALFDAYDAFLETSAKFRLALAAPGQIRIQSKHA